MRLGTGDKFVDNASSGGIYVSIDLDTGKLKGECHQLMNHGGRRLNSHPDSNLMFDGWEIPHFDDAKTLARSAATWIPHRFVGWDIAISNKGPVLVEGNDNNSLFISDIAFGGYLKHPMLGEIIKEA